MLAAPSYFSKLLHQLEVQMQRLIVMLNAISMLSSTQATITQAENSKKLETILVDGRFKSTITAGVDSANNYKDSTVDFANDGQ
jgi:hypothetical protein